MKQQYISPSTICVEAAPSTLLAGSLNPTGRKWDTAFDKTELTTDTKFSGNILDVKETSATINGQVIGGGGGSRAKGNAWDEWED